MTKKHTFIITLLFNTFISYLNSMEKDIVLPTELKEKTLIINVGELHDIKDLQDRLDKYDLQKIMWVKIKGQPKITNLDEVKTKIHISYEDFLNFSEKKEKIISLVQYNVDLDTVVSTIGNRLGKNLRGLFVSSNKYLEDLSCLSNFISLDFLNLTKEVIDSKETKTKLMKMDNLKSLKIFHKYGGYWFGGPYRAFPSFMPRLSKLSYLYFNQDTIPNVEELKKHNVSIPGVELIHFRNKKYQTGNYERFVKSVTTFLSSEFAWKVQMVFVRSCDFNPQDFESFPKLKTLFIQLDFDDTSPIAKEKYQNDTKTYTNKNISEIKFLGHNPSSNNICWKEIIPDLPDLMITYP